MDIVDRLGEVKPGSVSLSTISQAVRNRIPSGQRYTRKKTTQVATNTNRQQYIVHTDFNELS